MNIKKKINWKLFLWYSFLALSVPLAIVPMALCTLRNFLDADPSYFLSIMERIAEGKVLYKDVACGYPPIWFYMMASVKWIFHIPSGSEELYYVFHFLMQILSAFFLFKIIRCWGIGWRIAYFCSWLFVMMGHWMQANYLILEPLTVMFGLLAIWMVQKYGKDDIWLLFVAGVVASLSFLCKQYGLGFFILCLFLTIFLHKSNIPRILVFILGFIVPILVCIAIWGNSFIDEVFLNDYGTSSSIDELFGITFAGKIGQILRAAKYLCVRCAVALPITLLFIPFFFKEKVLLPVVFCWCGIIGFLLTFYFNFGIPRYLLLILPFVMLLIALTISVLDKAGLLLRIVFLVALSITTVYTIYADYHNRVWKHYILHAEYKIRKEEMADELRKLIPEGATLYTPNCQLCWAYYLADATPPNLATIGYSFGADITVEETAEQVKTADYVLSFDVFPAEPYFTKELYDYVFSHEAIYVSSSSPSDGWKIVLHDMSKMK